MKDLSAPGTVLGAAATAVEKTAISPPSQSLQFGGEDETNQQVSHASFCVCPCVLYTAGAQ